MPFLLYLIDVRDLYHDPRLLHIPELMIDGCAECGHGWGEVHVSIDEGRDVLALAADLMYGTL